MARTTRDDIWRTTLNKTVKESHRVSPADVAADCDATERTVRECLLSMYESGYLERHSAPSGEVRYSSPPFLQFEPVD